MKVSNFVTGHLYLLFFRLRFNKVSVNYDAYFNLSRINGKSKPPRIEVSLY